MIEVDDTEVTAVQVRIPWRRCDPDPAGKNVIVIDAETGKVVQDRLILSIDDEVGEIAFRPNPGSATYHVYYLPWQSSGGYYPTMTYPTPAELLTASRETVEIAMGEADSPSRAQEAGPGTISWVGQAPNPEPGWEDAVLSAAVSGLPRARTTHIQSVDDFHSFFPMEVIATPEEEEAFWAAFSTPDPFRGLEDLTLVKTPLVYANFLLLCNYRTKATNPLKSVSRKRGLHYASESRP